MYNYSIKTTYLDIENDIQDTQYRKEYLSAFNLENYDEEIIMDTINNLYQKYKDNKQLTELLQFGKQNNIYNFNDEMTFILFFAFEKFYYFHKALCQLNNDKNIDCEIIKNLQKK
tara:strand:+ start:1194 stop:1538 length:345 start_codon:yes stop_codon:yes gene_type:complete